MRIALYIEDGFEQLVLTPESDTERSLLAKLEDGTREVQIYRGGFYHCKGGWARWKDPYVSGHNHMTGMRNEVPNDASTFICLRPTPPEQETGG